MIPIVPIIFAVIIGPSYLFLRIEPGYLYGLDAYDPLYSPLLALLVSALPLLLGELLLRSVRRMVTRTAPGQGLPRVFNSALLTYRLSVLLVYAIAVYFLHWPRVIDDLGIKGWVLVDKIMVLAPFGISLAGSWVTSYRLQRLMRPGKRIRFAEFMLFQLRMTALPILPLGFVVLLVDIVENTESLRALFEQFPYFVWVAVLVFLVAIFLFMPLALRRIWTVRPLEDGPLRQELEAFSRQLRFQCREILVWKTQGDLINAAIIGLVAPLRYVILTDGLLRHLGADAIKAVFAHEVGHAKKNHIPLYFVFSASFIFLFLSLEQRFMPSAGEDTSELLLLLVLWAGLFVVYWWLLLGFISRRFECQADLFGATAVGDPKIFIDALEKISDLSGNVRAKRSWRHFSVAQRVHFLEDYFESLASRHRFRRAIRVMMGLFWSMAVLTLVVGVIDIREQHFFGLAQRRYLSLNLQDAEHYCQRALDVDQGDPRYWQLLGQIYQNQNRRLEAMDAYHSALERVKPGNEERRRTILRAIEKLEMEGLGTR